MTLSVSHQPSGSLQPRGPGLAELDGTLRRVLAKLDAALVGIALEGLSRTLARDIPGTSVLEDLWRHGVRGLEEQVRAAPDGVVGTNRLRAQPTGPVCGKLVAVALRDAAGKMTGILAAMRTTEQPKIGPNESRQLIELAAEIGGLLDPSAPRGERDGLLSWTALADHARTLERAAGGFSGCILYGDVDQLHVLNKLAGLAAGDQAIAAVAEVLQAQPLPKDSRACHISGDRFAVYVPNASLSQARRVAEQLCRTVNERCAVVAGSRTHVSISFGVATVTQDDGDLTQALSAAESACRAAKDRGRSRVEVYQDTDLSIIRRNDDVLAADRLHRALETQNFAIVAQPLVPLAGDSRTKYYELLVRLISETGAFVSPAQFMSAAARYQMLVELDRAMLARVFKRLRKAFKEAPERAVRFSVNLSGPTIGNPDFLEWLSSNIGPSSVPGEWLQLEITETAAVANVSQTQSLIRHLRARGIEFALDDFGTGVSSLAYLKAFDVSMLKLDGSFTRDLMTDSRSESLVRGIAQLGRSMGIQTVAECVETDAVRERLVELGIDRAQGFLFGQPVPFEDILSASEQAALTASP